MKDYISVGSKVRIGGNYYAPWTEFKLEFYSQDGKMATLSFWNVPGCTDREIRPTDELELVK